MREVLHVDDLAAASVHVMDLPADVWKAHIEPMLSHINVGTGLDCTIRELAETIARVVGFKGRLVFDSSKPDGAPRKLLDVSRRSEEHTSELQSLMRISYAVFCLKKK